RGLMATSFTEHPCRRAIVGTETSLAAMTAGDLASHHAAHYRGANVVLVVVGDVDADEVIAEARKHLSILPAGARPSHWGGREPAQERLRAVSIHGAVVQPYLSLAFHVPHAMHDDIPAIDALSGLLGQGRSSRLRRALALERGLVSDISCGIAAHRDTGVVVVRAAVTTSDIDEVMHGIFGEMYRLASELPSDDEMEKNIRRLEASYVLEHETPEAIANGLGFFELLGDHRWADEYIDRLAAVTPEDVVRAAAHYLTADNATLVVYGPEELGLPEGDVSELFAGRLAARVRDEEKERKLWPETSQLAESKSIWRRSRFERPMIIAERRTPERTRETLSGGATLITSHSDALPLTSIAVGFRGGHCGEGDSSSGSTYLAMQTVVRGTKRRSGSALADEVEGMGTSLGTIVDRDGFGVGSTCLSRLQSKAFSLLGEVVAEPAFEEREMEMARAEVESEIGETEDHPFRRAVLHMLPLVFPGHPYGRPLRGTRESLSALASNAVRSRYLSGLNTRGLVICASGSVETGRLREAAAALLEVLENTSRDAVDDVEPTRGISPTSVELEHGMSGQSHVSMGFAGPAAGEGAAVVVRFLARALTMMGGPLWVALRENPPHAYAVGASSLLLRAGGAVIFSVTARPGDEEQAVEGLCAVLRRVSTEGLAAEELERARSYVAGTMEIAMQRESTRAASYAMSELLGVGFEKLEEVPALVRALTNDDIIHAARMFLDPASGYATVMLKSV
ncbi:insulinase family protein, partial [bacterium]|nr:insulinase family protein [bacterium]